jgi:Domain of unknown function (DUF1877)
MSMVMEYVRLRSDELDELRRLVVEDPDEAAEYAGSLRLGDEDEEVSSRGMDTDKAWAGLQYLLAKLGLPVDVIGGGEPLTDDEWGHGPPRLLSAEKVAEAARFLDATPFSMLAEGYDQTEMMSTDVYPGIWETTPWALSYLEDYYAALVALFRAAAADHEPILIWMD